MKTKVYNMKRSIITISCILFSIGVMAQAHSSGGGSETGYKSTLGNQNTANGNYSLAAGWGNQANGQTSFALGYYSTAQGLNSMALGMYTKSQAAYGITIGKGYNNNKPLTNNTGGIMFGAGSNVPTLFISPENTENRTGKVAIGNVTSPLAKLHVAADANEDASILLASTGTRKSVIQFRNSDNNITVGSDNIMKFSATRYNFQTGKVGIGNVTTPQATLHIKAYGIENANIMLQPTDNTKNAAIIFRNSSNTISVGSDNIMNFAATSYSFTTGKVGIGTETPSCKLEVAGSAKTTSLQTETLNVTGDVSFGNLAGNTTKIVTVGTDGKLNAKSGLFIADNGNVRIGSGTGNPSKALEVNGTIRSKEVIVEVANWSDFVFDNNYNLMSLKETERFIKQNGHLPNVPSAAEVEKDGVQLGEMNAILLQKIEELTLYIIELEKKIDNLEKEYTRKE